MAQLRQSLVIAATVALVAWIAHGQTNMHTTIRTLDQTCEDLLSNLWARYNNASAAQVDGCDATCLQQCKQTLSDALWADQVQDCPPQSDIQRCFKYMSDAWEEYVANCALFQFGAVGSGATSAGAAESGESRRRLAQSEADAATGVAVSSSTVNVAGGCFPPFEDVEDFQSYVDGTYQFPTHSNAVGITLSVLFFVGLTAIGMLMKG